jgi:glycosyltransferase involved in cell wall biosynthesis
MHLTVASIMRNEADRFLPSWLEAVTQFADRIVVLDDGSTDDTADLCRRAGAAVYRGPTMFGNEWQARRELWHQAIAGADWVLHLDADQVTSCDPRPHMKAPLCYFKVYDLWSDDSYRDDAWWTGHTRFWWPAVHVPSLPAGFVDEWPQRGWHSGHVPMNVPGPGYPVHDCSILHYAYSSPELREQKAAMYGKLATYLSSKEQFHARTILVPNPNTKPLPFTPQWPLRLGAPAK